MDYLLADRLINVFILDREDQDLEKEVIELVVEKLPDVGVVPHIIFKACCMYMVWLAAKSDELDEETKAGISIMVKNALLIKKGNWQDVPAPEVMIDFYDVWNDYLQSERPKADTATSMQTASEVLMETDFFQTHSIDEGITEIIRQWAYDAIATTMTTLFKEKATEFKDEGNLVNRMTSAVVDWIDNLPKMGIDTNGIKYFSTLFDENELKQQYPVCELLAELKEHELPLSDDDVLDSSVIISAIGNDELAKEIGQIKLSLLEYGVYLYY